MSRYLNYDVEVELLDVADGVDAEFVASEIAASIRVAAEEFDVGPIKVSVGLAVDTPRQEQGPSKRGPREQEPTTDAREGR